MMRLWRSLLFPVLGMPFTAQMDCRTALGMAGTWMVRMRLCASAALSSIACAQTTADLPPENKCSIGITLGDGKSAGATPADA